MQVPSTVESIPAYIIIALLIVDLCATLRWACWYAWLTKDVGLLIFYSMVLFMFVFPNQLKKPLRLWLGHSIMMVATLVYMLPSEGTTGCMLITNANVARMAYTVLSLATMQTRTTAVWSILYGVTFFLSTFSPENFCNSTPMIWRLIAGEFAYVLFIIALSGVLENMVKMAMLRDLETHTLHNKHSAENVLLRMIYDVVIELDVDLRLVGPTPQLSGFLLHGTNRSIAGANFVDFIPFEEDRDTFQERITNAKSGLQNVAQVWHMHLCDGDSTAINVEAFSVSFEGFGGRTRHLVGIREFSDMPQGGASPGESPQPVAIIGGLDPGDATVVVNTATPDCPIIECSAAFTSVVGPVSMRSTLFNFTLNTSEFARWLQTVANMTMSGFPVDEVQAVNNFRVKIRRHGRHRHHAVATCRIVLGEDAAVNESFEGTEYYQRLHFNFNINTDSPCASNSGGSVCSSNSGRRPTADPGVVVHPSLSL